MASEALNRARKIERRLAPFGRRQDPTRNLFVSTEFGFCVHEVSNTSARAPRLVLLCAAVGASSTYLNAQEIDFGHISAFESVANEPAQRGAPSKKLVDDADQHAVFLTVWDSNTAGYKQLVPRDLALQL